MLGYWILDLAVWDNHNQTGYPFILIKKSSLRAKRRDINWKAGTESLFLISSSQKKKKQKNKIKWYLYHTLQRFHPTGLSSTHLTGRFTLAAMTNAKRGRRCLHHHHHPRRRRSEWSSWGTGRARGTKKGGSKGAPTSPSWRPKASLKPTFLARCSSTTPSTSASQGSWI